MESIKQNKPESEKIKTIQEQLIDLGLEKCPEINIEVFLGSHGPKSDTTAIIEKMQNKDILAIEFVGWDIDSLDLPERTRSVTEGFTDVTSLKEISPKISKFYLNLIGGLYGSKKEIIFYDLKENEMDVLNKLDDLLEETITDLDIESYTSIDEVAHEITRPLIDYGAEQNKREDVMHTRLVHSLKEVLEKNDSLKQKEKVNLMVFIGATHTKFYHRLKKEGNDIQRTQDVDSFPSALYQTMRYGYFELETPKIVQYRTVIELILFRDQRSLPIEIKNQSGNLLDDLGRFTKQLSEQDCVRIFTDYFHLPQKERALYIHNLFQTS